LSSNGNNHNPNHNHIHVEWRRSKVLELSSQGHTQSEIAAVLQVTQPTVNKDLAYLRKQAQDNLQYHIHEVVPEYYQKCLWGMKRNLKQTWEIGETSSDPRTKLQARAVANDIYKAIINLGINGVVVTEAIKYVNSKMDHLNSQEKKLLHDIREDAEAAEAAEAEDTGEVNSAPGLEEQQTHNGVF
jgi:predicted transcriptional regulator